MQNYEPGGPARSIGRLGKALGFTGTLLITPALYERTHESLMTYFANTLGYGLAKYLTPLTGLGEAYLVYAFVEFTVVALISWWIAKNGSDTFGQ